MTGDTQTKVQVGDLYFASRGFACPLCQVTLETSQGTRVSIKADGNGEFTLSQVLVKAGLSQACFTALDTRGIQSQKACVSFSPLMADNSYQGIFLPPTASLSASTLFSKEALRISGHSLSNASVAAIVDGISPPSSGQAPAPTRTDENGFYLLTLSNLSEGSHTLFMQARNGDAASLIADKAMSFTVLSFAQTAQVRVLGFFEGSILLKAIGIVLIVIILLIIRFRSRVAVGLSVLRTFLGNAFFHPKK